MQVDESTRPVGNGGVEVHAVTVPPELAGVFAVIGTFLLNVKGLPANDRTGGISCTVMLMVVVPEPPLFVPVIKWVVAGAL